MNDPVGRRELDARTLQAQKLESIGRLATGVAHDFNNALTSISAYAHLVLSRLTPDDPSHGDVREIVRVTEQAGRLVTQLQAFSRGERPEVETIDLNQSVRDVGRLLRVVLGERVALELQLTNRLPGVQANLGALEQVIMQLALNARDAMPEGGRLLVSTGQSETPDGPRVSLAFQDTGRGMDASTRRRAFEPFFTTKANGDSNGLGLTTVYAFVERLHGAIDIASEPGEGTTVRLSFPAAAAPGGLGRRPAPASHTVLMVEDEDTLRTVVDRILSDEGYRVLTAASGEEALELAVRETGPIDLLVSDVVLGGITGPELATKLKARHPALKTLLMSGYPGMPIGPVDDFLPKPFSPFELARRIRRVLHP
jgi:CheY-like chemotaxis protein